MNEAMHLAAELCRRYAENLSELPNGKDVALECAALIDDAAELVPAITKSAYPSCQEVFDAVSK